MSDRRAQVYKSVSSRPLRIANNMGDCIMDSPPDVYARLGPTYSPDRRLKIIRCEGGGFGLVIRRISFSAILAVSDTIEFSGI